jgi:hypothetical protein
MPLTVDLWHVMVAGTDVALAFPYAFVPAPIEQARDPIDACRALGLPLGGGGVPLAFVRGAVPIAVMAEGPPRRARGARTCPVSPEDPFEVVYVDGREALLLRPENLA